FRTLTTPRLEGVQVYRTKTRSSVEHTPLSSPSIRNCWTDTASLTKARGKLRDLQQQLKRWREGKVEGKAPALESVRKQVRTICSAQFVKLVLKAEVCAVRQGLELTYSTD